MLMRLDIWRENRDISFANTGSEKRKCKIILYRVMKEMEASEWDDLFIYGTPEILYIMIKG